MKTKTSTVLLIALVMATPAGLATWYSYGEAEPDYPGDVTEKFMFEHPPVAGLPVYFNVVLTELFTGAPNPSLGTLESRYHTPGAFLAPYGYMGVWRDCNLDGYIGTAETAQGEYSTAQLRLLEDVQEFTSPCEEGSLFNQNGWVYEFVWIYDGAERNQTAQFSRFINDTDVRMWGDSSLPGADISGGDGCFVNPPYGFSSSTGAMLDYADCHAERVIVGTINTADAAAGNSTGLGFHNDDAPDNPQCSDSTLNRNETHIWRDAPECPEKSGTGLYEEQSGDQAFSTWDCEQPNTRDAQDVKDPSPGGVIPENVTNPSTGAPIRFADDEGNFVRMRQIPAPDVQVHNPRGSYYDSINQTFERCDSDGRRGNMTTGVYAANSGFNHVYVDPEANVEQSTNKVTSDFVMLFYGGNANLNRARTEGQVCDRNFRLLEENQATTFAFDNDTQSHQQSYCTATRQKDMPKYLGLGKFAALYQASYYSSTGTSRCCGNYVTTRDGSLEAGVPEYWTFYADVGTGTTGAGATLPGGSGVYGKEWCGTATTGVVKGFDCDKTHWWNPAYGGTVMAKDVNGKDRGAYPGDTYDLRDIDCYDGSLASRIAPGVGTGTTNLHPNGPCKAV